MKADEVYYRPIAYNDDFTAIKHNGIPDELDPLCVFPSIASCNGWLSNHGYDEDEYEMIQYEDNDIEGHIYIDSNGNMIKEKTTIEVVFSTSITVDMYVDPDEKEYAIGQAEEMALEEFDEKLNEGLLGTSDFDYEAQTP